MKSNCLLSKIMLLLCLLVGSVNGVWAADKTMTFEQTSSSAGNLSGEVPSGVTATFKNTYTNNKEQLTSGNSMTLTLSGWSSDVTITGVTLQVKNNKSSGNGTATVKIGDKVLGTLSITNLGSTYQEKQLVITPTKTTSDLVITIEATANSVYCNKFVISYAEVADERAATTVTIDDSGITNRDVYLGTAAGKLSAIVKAGETQIGGATVTWESETESVATIASDGTVTLVGAGSTVITASYAGDAENYKPSTATYTLTVTNSNPNVPGTENNPYTVAQARAAIDAGKGVTGVYVKGIVCNGGFSFNSGALNYWISDDGSETNKFEVYKGKGIDGANFSSTDDIQVGDEVVVYGNLKKFNSTYEFDQGNQLVSLKRKANPELSFANTSVNVNLGDAFVAPVLTNTYSVEVEYTSSNTDVATVNASTGEVTILAKGEATITASFAGDATYLADDASYTITVIDPNEKGTVTNPYTVAEVIAMDTAPTENVYVHGFVVGFMKSGPTLSTKPSDFTVSNCALADAADESNVDNAMAVQFSNNTARAKLNLKDCPYNLNVGKYLLQGKIQKAFGKMGLGTTLVASKKIAEKIDITAAGMATYYTDCALDFTGLTDMYAYIVTPDAGSNYTLTRVNKVPAQTGLLLYNPNGGAASNVVPVLTEDLKKFDDNKLTGTLEKTTAGTNDYILNNGVEGVGFYKGNGQEIDMHRAYLSAGASARPFFLINFDSEATGISFVGHEATVSNRFFNLNGQQVKTPQKGLYVVNGKKVIIK